MPSNSQDRIETRSVGLCLRTREFAYCELNGQFAFGRKAKNPKSGVKRREPKKSQACTGSLTDRGVDFRARPTESGKVDRNCRFHLIVSVREGSGVVRGDACPSFGPSLPDFKPQDWYRYLVESRCPVVCIL
jgi:hypothetical protein